MWRITMAELADDGGNRIRIDENPGMPVDALVQLVDRLEQHDRKRGDAPAVEKNDDDPGRRG